VHQSIHQYVARRSRAILVFLGTLAFLTLTAVAGPDSILTSAGKLTLVPSSASLAGGKARLPTLLSTHRPAAVIIELGGNDGLRGGDVKAMRANLDAMVTMAQQGGAKVLLIGMRVPPNYGPSYTRDFAAAYTSVAEAHKVPLVPFFFEGFGERNEMFQSDRIHPTAAAQPLLLDNVWPQLVPLLGKPK